MKKPKALLIMITPNNAAPEAGQNSDNDPDEICVPKEAVQIDGQTPAVGDDVETKLSGKVTRVTDTCVMVKPSTFGDGVPAPTDDGDDGDDEDEEPDMMDAAKKADAEMGDMGM